MMKSFSALGLAFLLSVELQAQQFLRLKSYQSALSETLQKGCDILKKGEIALAGGKRDGERHDLIRFKLDSHPFLVRLRFARGSLRPRRGLRHLIADNTNVKRLNNIDKVDHLLNSRANQGSLLIRIAGIGA